MLVDRLWSNILQKVKVSKQYFSFSELPTHDALHIFFNARMKYNPYIHKFNRNLKWSEQLKCVTNFQSLSFKVVFSLDYPKEKLSIFSDIVLDIVIDIH